jgi:TolB-like protein/Tfp pilus assembly protein PilF
MAAPAFTGSGREDPARHDPEAKLSELHSYKRFFAELKRRQVFRVAAVYGAASFAILEASDILFPRIGLPDWTVTFVAVLAMIGFPVALVVAWVYERTSAGLRRTEEAETGELEAIASAPAASRWPVGLAAAAGTVLLLVGVWWALGWQSSAEEAPRTGDGLSGAYESIAVLPFANMSGQASDEYFSDGLTEELLNALARVPDLKVAGRTSSFVYKGENKDLREIGEALGVETILEGSVRRAGGRVRVTAQLIDARDGFHVWSSDWDRSLTAENVFDIQEEIAGAVARALASGTAPEAGGEPVLAAAGGIVPTGVRTSDLEAYDLYLLGRHGWASRSPEGLRDAVEYFEAALVRDSLFVPAWVGLAAAYNALPWWTDYPFREGGGRSKRAARRALELDPDNAEAMYTLATTLFEFDKEREESERLFDRAFEIDPDYPPGMTWYGQYLADQARLEEGLVWVNRAVEADPFSLHALNSAAGVQMSASRWRDAADTFDRALAVDPEFKSALSGSAYVRARLGEWEQAESLARRWFVLDGEAGAAELASDLIAGVRDVQERERALRAFETLSPRTMPPWIAAEWYLLIGERERALDEIDRMIAMGESEGILVSLFTIVGVEDLVGEPRFEAAIDRAGLRRFADNLAPGS